MRIALFANTDWYLYNFRSALARELVSRGHEVMLLSPPGPYGQKLINQGLDWQPVPMTRQSLNPIRELRLLFSLVGVLRRRRIQLVHGFTIKCAVYGSIAARIAGVRARVSAVAGMGYVFTSNDAKARLLRRPVRALMKLAFGGRCSAVILQNPDDLAELEQAGVLSGELVRVIPGSGVDTCRLANTRHGPPKRRIPQVTLASRMLKDKGIGELVQAAKIIRKRGLKVRCVLAGDPDPGNPASISPGQLRAWSEDGAVKWVGHVEDIRELLARSDIVVLPSYREGLPRSLVEAASAGLPIITTDVPGCRSVVDHEINGLLVPPRDAEALAEAIVRLIGDPDLARRLGEAAQEKAMREFDQSKIIESTIEVYRILLPGEAASAAEV